MPTPSPERHDIGAGPLFTRLFLGLRAARVPVSLKEYLALLEGVGARVADSTVDDFYLLARAILIKDERHLDRFDRVFAEAYRGVVSDTGDVDRLIASIPEDWLRGLAERLLSEEEKREIAALGGWEKLMDMLRQRLAEQQGRHQGGSKWIGTGGTSPFGAYGYNPEGVRIGQDGNRNNRAVKVWDRREFRNLDGEVEIGTRNIKVALRRLRRFARSGAAEELDLPDTIRSTARNGGWLDVRMVPERHNAAKVLLFLDVGGSMDPFVRTVEQLFSAARSEFKHLDYFYFHNCLYETVWRDNRRRGAERIDTEQVLRSYGVDYRVVVVGDAAMSPYELTVPGGSVEHWNPEAGEVWLKRLFDTFPRAVWLNPLPEDRWGYHASLRHVRGLIAGRMFPLTLDGLDRAMRELGR